MTSWVANGLADVMGLWASGVVEWRGCEWGSGWVA